MDSQKVLAIVAIALLAVVAVEGAVLITNGGSHADDDSTDFLKEQVELLSKKGGTINFVSAGHVEIKAGTILSVHGDIIYYESARVSYPLSSIQSIRINA